jgi:uncharacterized protein (DUF1800 family)
MAPIPRRQILRQGLWLAAWPCVGLIGACASQTGASASKASASQRLPLGSSAATGAASTLADYHLLNRLSWGANDADLARLTRIGSQAWLRQQLDGNGPSALPPAVQARIDAMRISQASLPDIAAELRQRRQQGDTLPTEEARKAARQSLHEELNRLAHEAASRHLMRALYSPQQLRERMTWFWFNHFNVFAHKHDIRAMLGDYEDRALRPHALGRFRDLLGAALHHPAMLRYLDNDQNAAGKLNENLARELMELHTLGVNGGYTQQDVQELARVLTGHGERAAEGPPKLKRELAGLYVQDGLYSFHPGRHDFGDKRLLGRLIKGQGATELDEALDLLAAHPATSRFVSRKLAMALCTDQPPAELVEHMASAFRASDGHIGRTLEAMVRHPLFTKPEARHLKDPVRYVVSAVRAAYDDRPILNTRPMENWLKRLGEGLYEHLTPDGYALASDAWSSAAQMTARFDIARAIGSGNAGLFKTDDPPTAAEQGGFAQLARPIYYQHVRALLGPDTRQALDTANSPQDWNTLYLAAPEFMYT